MTPEERFERIEQDLHIASGLILRVSDQLERVSDRLDRAVRLSVREARNERGKRREMDQRVIQLTNTVQAFIDSMQRGGNEHS